MLPSTWFELLKKVFRGCLPMFGPSPKWVNVLEPLVSYDQLAYDDRVALLADLLDAFMQSTTFLERMEEVRQSVAESNNKLAEIRDEVRFVLPTHRTVRVSAHPYRNCSTKARNASSRTKSRPRNPTTQKHLRPPNIPMMLAALSQVLPSTQPPSNWTSLLRRNNWSGLSRNMKETSRSARRC
jgi:hypothetical protein